MGDKVSLRAMMQKLVQRYTLTPIKHALISPSIFHVTRKCECIDLDLGIRYSEVVDN